MKKIISLITLIIVIAFSYTISNSNSIGFHSETNTLIEELACKHGQCHATAISTGNRCKHCVSNEGDKFCWQHK